MATKLDWRGEEVLRAKLQAAKDGIDETMAECVTKAKRTPAEGGTMPVDTSALQGSVQLRPAKLERNVAVGHWGSFDINYALFQEEGFHHHVAGLFVPGKFFLQDAAAEEYPQLVGRIRRRLR